jgi:hypothetical protein
MYSVTVKIEEIERRRRNAGLMHVLVGFFLILNSKKYYELENYEKFFHLFPFLAVAALSLFYGFFRRKIDLLAKYNFWLRLLQTVTFFVLGAAISKAGRAIDYVGPFAFAFLCLVLMFSERRAFQQTTIFFDEDGIKIPGYYKDHLVKWQDLNEVVVREDFLTLFHVNNKYLQYQVVQDLSTLEVTKLNAFCREQIEKVENTRLTS